MKTLKNISFLLAFACAMPVVAIDQSEGAKEAVVAKMQEVEQQNSDETKVVADKAEQPSMKDILDAANKYALAGATSLYGVAGGATAFVATLNATDSLKMALLAGGGTIAISAIPIIYFYNKYKAQFGEKFGMFREIAKSDLMMYMVPATIGAFAYSFTTIANIAGLGLGVVIGKAAQALGLGLKTATLTAAGTAIAIPSYIEARNRSDKKNPDSAYMTALEFMYAYAKNVVFLAFIGATTAGALMCAQK
jgi:hypothetical protein